MNDASIALAARTVLAGSLAVSAFAKLRSTVEVRQQITLVVNDRLAPIITPALPIAELVVAVALVAWWNPAPGVAALVLLGAFTVVLVRAYARKVPCVCFGAAGLDAPTGPASVLRNGVLAGLAVLAIATPSGASAGATIAAGAVFATIAALAIRAAR
ncbi:MAG TPA: MauE/DoxX family redox-associated membrane protein [Acidimicrobiia bacterium]|nr:MauE/DoxX family redox-associated membrane protein [Acidimicrobiia bacterium]